MLINTLEKMEEIVRGNRSLSWDGWTVVQKYPSEKGRTSKYGAFVNGKWHMIRRVIPDRNGWEIPDKFIK